jgi:hypothetical protein
MNITVTRATGILDLEPDTEYEARFVMSDTRRTCIGGTTLCLERIPFPVRRTTTDFVLIPVQRLRARLHRDEYIWLRFSRAGLGRKGGVAVGKRTGHLHVDLK